MGTLFFTFIPTGDAGGPTSSRGGIWWPGCRKRLNEARAALRPGNPREAPAPVDTAAPPRRRAPVEMYARRAVIVSAAALLRGRGPAHTSKTILCVFLRKE